MAEKSTKGISRLIKKNRIKSKSNFLFIILLIQFSCVEVDDAITMQYIEEKITYLIEIDFILH
jgi:hypothetical protein